MKWLKKLIGNWWEPIRGDDYYFEFSWVPCNKWHKMVLEPYYSRQECQNRCSELNEEVRDKPTEGNKCQNT